LKKPAKRTAGENREATTEYVQEHDWKPREMGDILGAGGGFSVLVADGCSSYLGMLLDIVVQDIRPDRVFSVSTGQEALDIYMKESPDILLLDWEMTGMTGVEAARRIRELNANKEDGKYPYIIVITGSNSPNAFEIAFRNGADDFLRKPVNRNELMARILAGKRLSAFNKKLVDQAMEMKKVSRIDSLTELYNRKHGEERLAEIMGECIRKKRCLALCYCDIDRFKEINDTYGHDAGDLVLKEMSRFFRGGVRVSDIAVRWGGDEFLLIFPDTPGDGVVSIIKRISDSMDRLSVGISLGKGEVVEIKPRISIGCAWGYPGPDAKWENFVTFADTLLYKAKAIARRSHKSSVVSVSKQVPETC
jgi:diguanylate cyclase (GGDEF)-like protein